jgi:phage gpG-like protein
MNKSGLDVTIDNRETFAMIENLIRKIERPEPLLQTVGKYIQTETNKMFASGSRPDHSAVRGEKWPVLAESTIFKKRSMHKRGKLVGNSPDKPLVESGLLRDDLAAPRAIKIENGGLVYGTERRNKKGFLYPAMHQTGGKDLPKRRWLFLTETDLNQICNTVKQWIDGVRMGLK